MPTNITPREFFAWVARWEREHNREPQVVIIPYDLRDALQDWFVSEKRHIQTERLAYYHKLGFRLPGRETIVFPDATADKPQVVKPITLMVKDEG